MGEHAVLARKTALVCALNKRIKVTLTPDLSQQINIKDQKLGNLNIDLHELQILHPFTFVTSAILLFKSQIKTGFTLEINAEFSNVMGLGSSAAVTVATIAVLAEWLNGKPLSAKKLFKLAKKSVIQVQGIGSGADIAASIYGGVLAFKTLPLKLIPLPVIPHLTAVFCGYKKPTKDVVALVNAAKQQHPKIYASIFHAMQVCVEQAMCAIKAGNWHELGQLFTKHHGLQHALGVSDQSLDQIVRQLCAQSQIFGAKISGAGLGDCVIGLGTLQDKVFPIDMPQQQQGVLQLTIEIDQQGLQYATY